MIKIDIIAIGKDKDSWVSDGSKHFLKLISKYAKVELVTIPSPKLSSSLSPKEIKLKESELIIKKMTNGYNIALSDGGDKFDSHKFSSFLEKISAISRGKINFIIGGAYGLDKKVLDKSDRILSLSSLTFSHQIVRIILLEQLFRSFSIINNTDYHK